MHSSTKQTPFFSNYGHHPRADPFQVKNVGSHVVENLAAHLAAIHDELAFQLYEAQDHYKDYIDCNRKIHPNFQIGIKYGFYDMTEYTNKKTIKQA
jgi:hypothetical protein